jgi:hypothetical protein
MRKTIQEILDHADELAKRFASFEPEGSACPVGQRLALPGPSAHDAVLVNARAENFEP